MTRRYRLEILGDFLRAEMVPILSKEGDEIVTKPRPIVYIQDVVAHIMATLDELDRYF